MVKAARGGASLFVTSRRPICSHSLGMLLTRRAQQKVGARRCDEGRRTSLQHKRLVEQEDAAVDADAVRHARPAFRVHLVRRVLQPVVVPVALVDGHREQMAWPKLRKLRPQERDVGEHHGIRVEDDQMVDVGQQVSSRSAGTPAGALSSSRRRWSSAWRTASARSAGASVAGVS